jgi:hypothetical protein
MQPKSNEDSTFVIQFYKRVYLAVKAIDTPKGSVLKLVWTREKNKAAEFSTVDSAEDFISRHKFHETKILKSKLL